MTTTKEPVTTGGWYEHTDGTVGLYSWNSGQLKLVSTVLDWEHVPSREESLAQDIPPPKDYTRG